MNHRGEARSIGWRWRVRLAALPLAAVVAGACIGRPPESRTVSIPDDRITVASFDFTESVILAEIYAQALESHGYRVVRAHELGPRELVEPALERGLVEMVPEYLGTALEFLNQGADLATADVESTRRELVKEFSARGVAVFAPAPARNANGFAVTGETARKHGLKAISDLAPIAQQLVIGGPPECPDRPLCLEGLERTYGLQFRSFVPTDASGPVTAGSLDAGEVDVAVLFTTSGYISERGYLLLEDDRGLQPAENVVPVVREEVLHRHGEAFRNLVDSISRRLETQDLIELNRSVNLKGEEPRAVARAWLRSHGFTN